MERKRIIKEAAEAVKKGEGLSHKRAGARLSPGHVEHEFAPVFDAESKVLILGSIPSPKSREQGFYYGHPRNRFWSVLAAVFGEERPETIPEKKAFLHRHHIALWDVLASCTIRGASDASIADAVPNDLEELLKKTRVRSIFTTGGTASGLYRKYCFSKTGLLDIRLPSTSPANCAVTEEVLILAYGSVREALRT